MRNREILAVTAFLSDPDITNVPFAKSFKTAKAKLTIKRKPKKRTTPCKLFFVGFLQTFPSLMCRI